MATISKSISIKAPVDRVFAYLIHPEHLPEIWPSLVEVTHVKTKPDGAHSYDWLYKMAGIKFRGHAETVQVEHDKLVVVKNETGIPSTFRWTYGAKDGATELNLEVDYTVPIPILGKLAAPIVGKLNEHEMVTLLENLKTRMEATA